VGKRPTRPDGVEKVTGRTRYGADAFAPGMLIGKGIEYERIQTIVTDTTSLGYNECTGGSRVAFSCGLATIVAVDGQIYNGARFQPIPEGAKVFLLAKLTGG